MSGRENSEQLEETRGERKNR